MNSGLNRVFVHLSKPLRCHAADRSPRVPFTHHLHLRSVHHPQGNPSPLARCRGGEMSGNPAPWSSAP